MSGPPLVINAGSSSIKFSGCEAPVNAEPVLLFKGQIEGIGLAPHMSAQAADRTTIAEKRWPADGHWNHQELFNYLFKWLDAQLCDRKPSRPGHRRCRPITPAGRLLRLEETAS